MKSYLDLTKTGIILFVIMSGLAGYAVSYEVGQEFELWHPIVLVLGLYLTSAGSFAINQAQEWRLDKKMPRTVKRPIPQGKISPWQAYALGVMFCVFGYGFLYVLEPLAAHLGLLTVILYNGFYTLFWKKNWAFGAVPGAIPGAMPVLIGYATNTPYIFSPDAIYLFLIMFLWQMPHFWCLSIRFQKDYKAGGFPVITNTLGVNKTLFHIGFYLFAYVGVALASPWFVHVNLLYVLLVVPISIKLVFEFVRFFNEGGRQRWLPFFLWTNMSMLIFLGVPVFDKWFYYYVRVAGAF